MGAARYMSIYFKQDLYQWSAHQAGVNQIYMKRDYKNFDKMMKILYPPYGMYNGDKQSGLVFVHPKHGVILVKADHIGEQYFRVIDIEYQQCELALLQDSIVKFQCMYSDIKNG